MAGPTDGGPAFSRAIEFPAPLENKSSPIIFVKLSPGKSLPGFKLRFLAEKEAGRVVTPTTSTRRCSNPAWEQALCLLFYFLFLPVFISLYFSRWKYEPEKWRTKIENGTNFIGPTFNAKTAFHRDKTKRLVSE